MRFSFVIILVLVSCSKENQSFETKVIAHAGAGLDISLNPFPDNTQDAVTYSLNIGVKCIEIDLQLTSDDHLMLFHDNYLNGKTTHEGCVNSKSKNEMEEVRYAFFASQRINHLSEMDFGDLEELFLDIRHYNWCNGITIDNTRIVNAINSFRNNSEIPRIIVASNNLSILDEINAPGLLQCYEAIDFDNLKSVAEEKDYPLFIIRNERITQDQIKYVQDLGKKVIVFDMRTHDGNKKALEKNPDYIMTDAIQSGLSLTQ